MLKEFKSWYTKNFDELLNSYLEFLKFKTISAKKENKSELVRCADWLARYIKKIGMNPEVIQTSTYPIVYAEKIIDEKLPTLLIYGHYDVQPVDPILEWTSDPFEPIVKDDIVYARGASDDKGQIFYSILAMQSILSLKKKLNINIKFCIEGEEESKSKGLFESIDKLKEKFKSDYLLVVDFGLPAKDIPAITLGIRGLISLSCEFIGSKTDLHSGEHGGLAYNPLRAVVEVLAKLVDKDGRVNIEHFYDDVTEIENPKKLFDLDFDVEKYKTTFGIKELGGEKDFKGVQANWLRPTLEINGIGGGYFQEGFKTVIPSKVSVKISSRLVPNQNPDKIVNLIKDFLEKNVPKQIDIKVKYEGGGGAVRADGNSLIAKATAEAYEEVFEKPCKRILAGGSVPVVEKIVEKLKCQPVMMGTALMGDNIHAPNEHFGLDRFEKGFLTVARIIQILGQKK
jgi:acetylornithine deacetylase/succinyl-diaminopimelate desuccinylase-like protein